MAEVILTFPDLSEQMEKCSTLEFWNVERLCTAAQLMSHVMFHMFYINIITYECSDGVP